MAGTESWFPQSCGVHSGKIIRSALLRSVDNESMTHIVIEVSIQLGINIVYWWFFVLKPRMCSDCFTGTAQSDLFWQITANNIWVGPVLLKTKSQFLNLFLTKRASCTPYYMSWFCMAMKTILRFSFSEWALLLKLQIFECSVKNYHIKPAQIWLYI